MLEPHVLDGAVGTNGIPWTMFGFGSFTFSWSLDKMNSHRFINLCIISVTMGFISVLSEPTAIPKVVSRLYRGRRCSNSGGALWGGSLMIRLLSSVFQSESVMSLSRYGRSLHQILPSGCPVTIFLMKFPFHVSSGRGSKDKIMKYSSQINFAFWTCHQQRHFLWYQGWCQV